MHLDLALLWLWHRPVAIAPIGPLAWEPPYAERKKERKSNVINPLPWKIDLYHREETRSSLVAQRVKDLVLSLLWSGFKPWSRNFYMPKLQKKKKTKQNKTKKTHTTRKRDSKPAPHPDKLSYLQPVLLRGPSSFLKIPCSLLSWLYPCFLSPIKEMHKLSNFTFVCVCIVCVCKCVCLRLHPQHKKVPTEFPRWHSRSESD